MSREVLILYGSQTGNAEDLAEELFSLLINRHFTPQITPMDEYPIHNLITKSLIIFICSTTGQGEEPDNMKNSWKFLLRRDLPLNSLINLNFAVLGLGDSSYQKYNFVAKRLEKRIIQLGATQLLPLCLADEQHELGLDAVTIPWLRDICTKLLDIYPLPNGTKILPDSTLHPPKFAVTSISDKTISVLDTSRIANSSEFFTSQLVSNTRVTSIDHFQDTRHLILNIEMTGLKYDPGDVCCVLPSNSQESVDTFISILNLDPKQEIKISQQDVNRKLPSHLPQILTIEDLVYKLDLNCIPRRSFFTLLSKLSKNQLEKEKLEEFTSTTGQQDLFDYCNLLRKTLLEILIDFPQTTAQLTLEYLVDLIPFIKPRLFSIASSQQKYPHQIHLLVARVEYRTKLVTPRLGLCSNWLAKLLPNSIVPVYVKKGGFDCRYTLSENSLIMIGPGTGVAPFRSIIQYRIGRSFHENILFFGCRSCEKDFYFRDEWKELQETGCMRLYTAFSRDSDKKIYVQDILKRERLLIADYLRKESVILIAGNANQMPDGVLGVIRDIIKEMNELADNITAQNIIDAYIKTGRIQLETWS